MARGLLQPSRWITAVAGRAAAIFYELESTGGPVPDGPVLVVANHPNSLLDPLIIFRVAGRPTRPLAKAPLFDQLFVGTMLRGLGGLPVYRRQDNAALMGQNEDTFRRAIDALKAGDAVQIYPEGTSHSEPALLPMRTGAARIAIGTEVECDWGLGLTIVPIGITYRRKALFRGSALAVIGEPFHITDLKGLHEQDPVAAVRALTDRIETAIRGLTLNLTESEDQPLIETAERLYVREKHMQGWREREGLRERLPRLQAFARGLAWLRANDPARHERLRTAVARHANRLKLLGVQAGEVPPAYPLGGVARYALFEGVPLLVGLPLAAIGFALWSPAYFAIRFFAKAVRPEYEAVATYKVAGAFFAVPALWAVYTVIAWQWLGTVPGIATLIALPLLGLVAIAWHGRWRRVREDVLLFLRVVTRPRSRDRLAAERRQLVAEFDAVLSEMQAQSGAD